MSFAEAQAQLYQLREQYHRGTLPLEQYIEAVNALRVADSRGVWWQPNPYGDDWLYWNGSDWLSGTPEITPAAIIPQTASVPHVEAKPTEPLQTATPETTSNPPQSQFVDTENFTNVARQLPTAQRPESWWNTLSILGGGACGYLWFVYSSVRGMPKFRFMSLTESPLDFIPALLLLLVPIFFLLKRKATAALMNRIGRSGPGKMIGVVTAGAGGIWIITKLPIFSETEGLDLLTPLLMLALPIVIVAFRTPLDRLLKPVHALVRWMPPLLRMGIGMAIPFLTANILYQQHIIEYSLLHWNLVIGTLLSYALVRTPRDSNMSTPTTMPTQVGLFLMSVVVIAFAAHNALAHDFLKDPFNLNDGLRTDGFATLIAGIATTTVSMLINGVEVARVLLQARTPLKEGEEAQHRQFTVQVRTVDVKGNQSTQLGTGDEGAIYFYAYCTDEKGRFPAGESTIQFVEQAPSSGVTVQDLAIQHGERCAVVTAVPTPRGGGSLPATVTVIVSAGDDGLIQVPVVLSLQQSLHLTAEMVNGNRTRSKQRDYSVFDAWENKEEHSWNPGELVVFFRSPDSDEPAYPGFKPIFEFLPSVPDYLDIPPLVTDDNLTWRTHPKLKPDVKIPPDWLNEDGVIVIRIRCLNMPAQPAISAPGGTGIAASAGSAADLATMGYYLAPILELRYKFDTEPNQTRSYLGVALKPDQFITDGIDELGITYYLHNGGDRDELSVAPGYTLEAIEFTLSDLQKEKFTLNEDITFNQPGQKRFTLISASPLLYTDEIISDSSLSPFTYTAKADVQPDNLPKIGPPIELKTDTTTAPGYIFLKLWVVPGTKPGTSEASCYACMAPDSLLALQGLPLMLAVENVGIGSLDLTGPEQIPTNQSGLSAWVLHYSGLTWDNYSMAGFTVKCGVPIGQNPPQEATEVLFNLGNNVSHLVTDFFGQQSALNLNNPLFSLEGTSRWRKVGDYLVPDELSGPACNIASIILTAKNGTEPVQLNPYICGNYSSRIYRWMLERRFGTNVNVDPDTLCRMNGIDLNEYSMWCLGPITHHFAGFYLSGTGSMQDPRFIDPWWRQDWSKAKYQQLDGLYTINGERLALAICVASLVVLAVLVQALCMAVGLPVSPTTVFILQMLRGGTLITAVESLTVTSYGEAAGDFENGQYKVLFRASAHYKDRTLRRWDRDAVEEFFRNQFPEVPPITGHRTW